LFALELLACKHSVIKQFVIKHILYLFLLICQLVFSINIPVKNPRVTVQTKANHLAD